MCAGGPWGGPGSGVANSASLLFLCLALHCPWLSRNDSSELNLIAPHFPRYNKKAYLLGKNCLKAASASAGLTLPEGAAWIWEPRCLGGGGAGRWPCASQNSAGLLCNELGR